MLKTFFFGILLVIIAANAAHARRWQNLQVGYREFQTAGGIEGITVVYSITADLLAGAVVFDLDIERRGMRISQSMAEVRVGQAELPDFEALLKTFDQWRDKSREIAAPAFDKPVAHVAGIEWRFHWSGTEAQLASENGTRRHPIRFAEQDVTVFRVLLASASDMAREITAFQRAEASGPESRDPDRIRRRRSSR